jgi:hypothetical protein
VRHAGEVHSGRSGVVRLLDFPNEESGVAIVLVLFQLNAWMGTGAAHEVVRQIARENVGHDPAAPTETD